MKKKFLLCICCILVICIVYIVISTVLYNKTVGMTLKNRQYKINTIYKDAKIDSEHFLGKSNSSVLDIFYCDNKLGMAFFSQNEAKLWELSKIELVSLNEIILFEVSIENQNYYVGTINNNSNKVTITFEYEEQSMPDAIQINLKKGFFIVCKPYEKHKILLDFE